MVCICSKMIIIFYCLSKITTFKLLQFKKFNCADWVHSIVFSLQKFFEKPALTILTRACCSGLPEGSARCSNSVGACNARWDECYYLSLYSSGIGF